MSETESNLLDWLVGNAKRAWWVRLCILAAMVAGPIVVYHFADVHYDAKYVGQLQYSNDLKNQEEKVSQTARDLATRTLDLASKLTDQSGKLDAQAALARLDHDNITGIAKDIQWLKDQKQREISK